MTGETITASEVLAVEDQARKIGPGGVLFLQAEQHFPFAISTPSGSEALQDWRDDITEGLQVHGIFTEWETAQVTPDPGALGGTRYRYIGRLRVTALTLPLEVEPDAQQAGALVPVIAIVTVTLALATAWSLTAVAVIREGDNLADVLASGFEASKFGAVALIVLAAFFVFGPAVRAALPR